MTASVSTEPRFRSWVATDQDAVIALIIAIQRDEFGVAITLDDQPDLAMVPTFYQSGHGDFWVAEQDGKIVGTIALKDIGNKQSALRKMFVAPHARGKAQGVAHALLVRLLAHARQQGVRDIYLGTTDAFVAAQRFYERNGFVSIAKTALPPAFPVMAVDTCFYHLQLGIES
jgi:N-acetylglutamate synthase-like GNAT family acetyltransferase